MLAVIVYDQPPIGATVPPPSHDIVTETLGHRPGKVIGVNLNFRSRVLQRGEHPSYPSYFLIPPTSLSAGGTVLRPAGTSLLRFEGEIAIVIGKEASHVTPGEAWGYAGWVTAANDISLFDMRYADQGANVRSKGGDGFTPIGPELLDSRALDPRGVRLRTWLNGELVQNDTSGHLLFDFDYLIADLSRLMRLEPGDVILTGTPTGATIAELGDRIEVEVSSTTESELTTGRLRSNVEDGPRLATWGAQPVVDSVVAAAAAGRFVDALTPAQRDLLQRAPMAALITELRRHGYECATMSGVAPLGEPERVIGRARTVRFVPYRPDIYDPRDFAASTQKVFDTLQPRDVIVLGVGGDRMSGTVGDIMALRAQQLSVAGMVTDGLIRETSHLRRLRIPIYAAGTHTGTGPQTQHVPWETDVTISCGGAAVRVGDVIVADPDGIVVIPPHLLDEIVSKVAEEADLGSMAGPSQVPLSSEAIGDANGNPAPVLDRG